MPAQLPVAMAPAQLPLATAAALAALRPDMEQRGELRLWVVASTCSSPPLPHSDWWVQRAAARQGASEARLNHLCSPLGLMAPVMCSSPLLLPGTVTSTVTGGWHLQQSACPRPLSMCHTVAIHACADARSLHDVLLPDPSPRPPGAAAAQPDGQQAVLGGELYTCQRGCCRCALQKMCFSPGPQLSCGHADKGCNPLALVLQVPPSRNTMGQQAAWGQQQPQAGAQQWPQQQPNVFPPGSAGGGGPQPPPQPAIFKPQPPSRAPPAAAAPAPGPQVGTLRLVTHCCLPVVAQGVRFHLAVLPQRGHSICGLTGLAYQHFKLQQPSQELVAAAVAVQMLHIRVL